MSATPRHSLPPPVGSRVRHRGRPAVVAAHSGTAEGRAHDGLDGTAKDENGVPVSGWACRVVYDVAWDTGRGPPITGGSGLWAWEVEGVDEG